MYSLIDAVHAQLYALPHIHEDHAQHACDERAAPRTAKDVADDARRQAVKIIGIDPDGLRLIGRKARDGVYGYGGDEGSDERAQPFPPGLAAHQQIDAQAQGNQRAAYIDKIAAAQRNFRQKAARDDERDEQQRLLIGKAQFIQHPLAHAQQY